MQNQVHRSAERGVDRQRVLHGRVGEDVGHRHAACVERDQRAGRPPRHVQPDRVPGRGQRRVAQRHAKCLAHDLRGRGRAEKLAAAAGRCAGVAPDISRMLQRDVAVRESRADRLHARGVFPLDRQQGDAPRHQDARQIAVCRKRHHHRGQTLVARGDAEHAAPRRQRSNQAAENRRGVVAERQAVEHRRRPLGSAVAGIGTRGSEGDRTVFLEHPRGGFHEEADLPMTGVITQRDRRAVSGTNAAVRRQHQELPAAKRRGIPAHPRVLAPAKQIARRPLPQHVRRKWQRAGRPGCMSTHIGQCRVVVVEEIFRHTRMVARYPDSIACRVSRRSRAESTEA